MAGLVSPHANCGGNSNSNSNNIINGSNIDSNSLSGNNVNGNTISEKSKPFRRFLRKGYHNDTIRDDVFLESELILLAFATGIQDAATYSDYLCFASNQTGNTVLLAVSAAGLQNNTVPHVDNPIMSLCVFLGGSLIMGQIGNWIGNRRRCWLILTNLLQTSMAFAAVGIQYVYPIEVAGPLSLLVLALLAFSSGAQVAMARSLKINEITTAMATSAYVDLFIDPKLLRWKNRPRNRRALFLVALFIGSFVGAFAYKRVNSPFVLLLSAVGKFIVTVGFFFNKSVERKKEEGSQSA